MIPRSGLAAIATSVSIHKRPTVQATEKTESTPDQTYHQSGLFQNCCHDVVEPFVHKLGNHFTLLQLVVGAMSKRLPSSREIEILEETISRTVELTRRFAEYYQQPSRSSGRGSCAEILAAALIRVRCAAHEKLIAWEERVDETTGRVLLEGDPFLLEFALGHVLQNAIEASAAGDQIIIQAKTFCAAPAGARVSICVFDFGTGIAPNHLPLVFRPFFTTKPHHDGLGLAVARRYVEIHGGFLKLTSFPGKGTQAEINLPAEAKKTDLTSAA